MQGPDDKYPVSKRAATLMSLKHEGIIRITFLDQYENVISYIDFDDVGVERLLVRFSYLIEHCRGLIPNSTVQ